MTHLHKKSKWAFGGVLPHRTTCDAGVSHTADRDPFAVRSKNIRSLFGRLPSSSQARGTFPPAAAAPDAPVTLLDDAKDGQHENQVAEEPEGVCDHKSCL